MKQFIKFGVIGVTNTVVSYSTYIATLCLCRDIEINEKYDYFIASFVAFILSVLWSFYWNNRITFKLEETSTFVIWKVLLKTYICYSVTGVLLSNCLLYVWVDLCSVPKEIAPIINVVITMPANFFLNKMWVYGKVKY